MGSRLIIRPVLRELRTPTDGEFAGAANALDRAVEVLRVELL